MQQNAINFVSDLSTSWQKYKKKRFSKFLVTPNNIAAFWVTLEDIVNEWAMFSDELRIIQKLSQYNY